MTEKRSASFKKKLQVKDVFPEKKHSDAKNQPRTSLHEETTSETDMEVDKIDGSEQPDEVTDTSSEELEDGDKRLLLDLD